VIDRSRSLLLDFDGHEEDNVTDDDSNKVSLERSTGYKHQIWKDYHRLRLSYKSKITPHHYFLLPHAVEGFALKSKQWGGYLRKRTTKAYC
jgi:hypothetical protein